MSALPWEVISHPLHGTAPFLPPASSLLFCLNQRSHYGPPLFLLNFSSKLTGANQDPSSLVSYRNMSQVSLKDRRGGLRMASGRAAECLLLIDLARHLPFPALCTRKDLGGCSSWGERAEKGQRSIQHQLLAGIEGDGAAVVQGGGHWGPTSHCWQPAGQLTHSRAHNHILERMELSFPQQAKH